MNPKQQLSLNALLSTPISNKEKQENTLNYQRSLYPNSLNNVFGNQLTKNISPETYNTLTKAPLDLKAIEKESKTVKHEIPTKNGLTIEEALKNIRETNSTGYEIPTKNGLTIEEALKNIRETNSTKQNDGFKDGFDIHRGLANSEKESLKNTKKGEGSGKDGKRTVKEIYQNIQNTGKDVSTAVAKSAVQTGIGLAQFATFPHRMIVRGLGLEDVPVVNSLNKLLDARNPGMQRLQEGLKANSKLGKVVKTGTDIATLGLGGAGQAGKLANITSKVAPKVMANPNIGGKIARGLVKTGDNIIQGAKESATIGADYTTGDGVIDAGLTALLGTRAGIARKGAKTFEEFAKKSVSDPITMGENASRMKEQREKIKEIIEKLSTKKEGKVNSMFDHEVFEFANQDEAVDYIAKKGIFSNITNGKTNPTDALKIEKEIKERTGKALEDYIGSEKEKITLGKDFLSNLGVSNRDLNAIQDLKDANGNSLSGIINKIKNGGEVSASELYEVKKAAGKASYLPDGDLRNKSTAAALKNLNDTINKGFKEETLFKNIDGATYSDFNKQYQKSIYTENILNELANKKLDDLISPGFGGALVGALSIGLSSGGLSGILMGIFGNALGKKITNAINKVNINKLSPEFLTKLNRANSEKEVLDMLKSIEEKTTSNLKYYTEMGAKNKEAEFAKKAKEFVDSYLNAPQGLPSSDKPIGWTQKGSGSAIEVPPDNQWSNSLRDILNR